MNNTQIIHMTSGPRNISTALMYSFGNREDFSIVDEPLYAYYLNSTLVEHPGKEEVLASQSTDPKNVINGFLEKDYSTPFAFIKNMGHHLKELELDFLLALKNVFLIRNTTQILTSLSKIIDNPILRDLGIKKEWEAYEFLKTNGKEPIVIDSGLLLENPQSVLSQLCEKLGIPFSEKMLSWPAGPRKEDGIWAKYWYNNVHLTTGFKKQKSSSDPLPSNLEGVNQEALYYYKKLLDKAIRP